MLAVWCFTVFAAVGERLAVSGKRERDGRGGQDGEREYPFSFLCIRIFSPCSSTFHTLVLAVVLLERDLGAKQFTGLTAPSLMQWICCINTFSSRPHYPMHPNPFQQYLTQSPLKPMILLQTARQSVGFIDDC